MNSFTSPDFSSFITYIVFAVIIAASFAVCFLAYKILNTVPAKWLCDYDEEPDETVLGIRFNYKQSGIITSALFAVLNSACFALCGFSFYTLFIFLIMFVLLLVTLSDGKFTIIPDQFTIALAVLSLGFGIYDLCNGQYFISQWWHIPLGAVCGGGFLMLINLLSLLIFKKLGIGFGDVKLMCALGACLGFPKVFLAMIAAVLIAFLYIIFTVLKKIFTKKETEAYFAFGPYLAIGSALFLIFVNQIDMGIELYLSMLGL